MLVDRKKKSCDRAGTASELHCPQDSSDRVGICRCRARCEELLQRCRRDRSSLRDTSPLARPSRPSYNTCQACKEYSPTQHLNSPMHRRWLAGTNALCRVLCPGGNNYHEDMEWVPVCLVDKSVPPDNSYRKPGLSDLGKFLLDNEQAQYFLSDKMIQQDKANLYCQIPYRKCLQDKSSPRDTIELQKLSHLGGNNNPLYTRGSLPQSEVQLRKNCDQEGIESEPCYLQDNNDQGGKYHLLQNYYV